MERVSYLTLRKLGQEDLKWLALRAMNTRLKKQTGTGEMVQPLEVTAFKDDLGLVPSNSRWLTTTCNSRDLTPSSKCIRDQKCRWYTYIHIDKTVTYIK